MRAQEFRQPLPEDGRPNAQHVVVISYGLWQRRFGRDASVVGKNIQLNGEQFTVTGVLPQDFIFPRADAEMAVPLVPETDPRRTERESNFLRDYARLQPEATPQEVQAELAQINERLRLQYPEANAKKTAPRVLLLQDEVVGDYRKPLLILLAVVFLLLLIACANLANLLLARASSRGRELAIRLAVGATSRDIIRQMLVECLMLAFAGGTVGLLICRWGVYLLLALSPSELPRAQEVLIDGRVFAFALILSLLVGIIFGLLPAISASKVNLNQELKGVSNASTEGQGRKRTRNWLVISEVAISLLLLIGAGLLIKSFLRLQQVDPGFNAGNVLALRLSLPITRYDKPGTVVSFYKKLGQRIRSLPGVEMVGAASVLPLSGMNARGFYHRGPTVAEARRCTRGTESLGQPWLFSINAHSSAERA